MDRALQAVHSAVDHVTDALAWLEDLTGLPPLVLFTALALLVGAYYLISGIVAPSQIGSSPLEAADELANSEVKVQEMTLEQLGDYDGRDLNKPLFVAIKGRIYDVSSAKDFYGPGAPYSVFAGKDASRALAKMTFQAADLTGDLEGLTDQELEVLKEWEVNFDGKYPKVGVVAPSKPALKQTYAQVSGTREAEHKVEEEPPKQTYAEVSGTREADKVEEEPPNAATSEAEHKMEEEPQNAATSEPEHKMEEEHPKPSYAQVAATGEAEHKVEEERPKQDREVMAPAKEHGDGGEGESVKQSNAGQAGVTDGQAEVEQPKPDREPASSPRVGESKDGEAKGSVVEHSSESASESKPNTQDGDQSSSITRDVPVSAGDKAESEDGNESSVVTRDIPVSGEHEVDQSKQQQREAEAEDGMTKQQNEVDENNGTMGQQNGVDENRLSSGTLEQVLEPSMVISKRGVKQSQDEKDFELVDKGKVPDAESLLSIRDSDYIRGLQDVRGL